MRDVVLALLADKLIDDFYSEDGQPMEQSVDAKDDLNEQLKALVPQNQWNLHRGGNSPSPSMSSRRSSTGRRTTPAPAYPCPEFAPIPTVTKRSLRTSNINKKDFLGGDMVPPPGNGRNEQSIEEWFLTYGDPLYRFALHSIGNPEDARDVVQEVFLRAQKAYHAFRGDAQVRTWLFQIARNYISDCLREKRNHRKNWGGFDTEPQISDENLNVRLDLKKAITSLKPEYRQVIFLRFIEDLSVEDTARILRWTPGKVRTTQYRALQNLRDILHRPDSGTERKMSDGQ